MKLLGHRLKMLHLKDRAKGFPISYDMNPDSGHFVPLGKGTLDWPAILAEGERLGVEHYFLEQDQTQGPAIDAVRESYRYLSKLV
jgi:sugar phosphate isomerase/epimerase